MYQQGVGARGRGWLRRCSAGILVFGQDPNMQSCCSAFLLQHCTFRCIPSSPLAFILSARCVAGLPALHAPHHPPFLLTLSPALQ